MDNNFMIGWFFVYFYKLSLSLSILFQNSLWLKYNKTFFVGNLHISNFVMILQRSPFPPRYAANWIPTYSIIQENLIYQGCAYTLWYLEPVLRWDQTRPDRTQEISFLFLQGGTGWKPAWCWSTNITSRSRSLSGRKLLVWWGKKSFPSLSPHYKKHC